MTMFIVMEMSLMYFPCEQNLWPSMYLAYVVDPSAEEGAWRDISAICERDKELRSKTQRLRRQLLELERDAFSKGLLEGPIPSSVVGSGNIIHTGISNTSSSAGSL